jgi:hypothetical protein
MHLLNRDAKAVRGPLNGMLSLSQSKDKRAVFWNVSFCFSITKPDFGASFEGSFLPTV